MTTEALACQTPPRATGNRRRIRSDKNNNKNKNKNNKNKNKNNNNNNQLLSHNSAMEVRPVQCC